MLDNVKNNINWLAQCKRRFKYPIYQSDICGLTAFEYGWKSFNNLYSEFKKGYDKEKMIKCVDKYIDAKAYVSLYRDDIIRFCDVEHRIYLGDSQYESLNHKLSGYVCNLRDSLESDDSFNVIHSLINCLYVIRNARVHGAFGTGKVHFSFLPKAIYTLNIHILSSKLGVSIDTIKSEIDNQLTEIKSGIA